MFSMWRNSDSDDTLRLYKVRREKFHLRSYECSTGLTDYVASHRYYPYVYLTPYEVLSSKTLLALVQNEIDQKSLSFSETSKFYFVFVCIGDDACLRWLWLAPNEHIFSGNKTYEGDLKNDENMQNLPENWVKTKIKS